MENLSLLQRLESLLKNHDWYYAWSDDHRVYKKGAETEKQIKELVNQLGKEGEDLYDEYKKPKTQISEKKLTKAEKTEKEKIVMGLKGQKKDFTKRYGKKDAESVMYATATKLAKQVKESDKKKVEEAIAKYFEAKTKKYNDNPALKGKQKTTLPDKLQAAIIKKKGGKVEENDMLFTNDFAKQDQVNYIDDEGRMAKQQLFKIKKYAQELCDILEDNTQLEGWVQAKITKAEEAIGAVKHYMEYEMFRKTQG
jgi:hypothetical protein